ncbi:hypothetical protein EVJ58_g4440 [Rhodofomes roseus]|uniref:Uncharacterized protein n=1 Tax=Rhodofomes roseus TaxID=34475 RepID=A0A4Y9YHV4_9APHY|nr:hypothetical protein EVJ58_g4440 [Rhodofomes roseus]
MESYRVLVLGASGVVIFTCLRYMVEFAALASCYSVVKLEVVDTPGIDGLKDIDEDQIRDAHGFILVFDVTLEQSLHDVVNLKEYIMTLKGPQNQEVAIAVAAAKRDLVSTPLSILSLTDIPLTQERERVISRDTIRQYARQLDVEITETSAKRGWGVYDTFVNIVKEMRRCQLKCGPLGTDVIRSRTTHDSATASEQQVCCCIT